MASGLLARAVRDQLKLSPKTGGLGVIPRFVNRAPPSVRP